jgi:hypothetical protein
VIGHGRLIPTSANAATVRRRDFPGDLFEDQPARIASALPCGRRANRCGNSTTLASPFGTNQQHRMGMSNYRNTGDDGTKLRFTIR